MSVTACVYVPTSLEINMYARCSVIFGEMKCVHKSMKMLKCHLHHLNCVLVDHNSACVGRENDDTCMSHYVLCQQLMFHHMHCTVHNGTGM